MRPSKPKGPFSDSSNDVLNFGCLPDSGAIKESGAKAAWKRNTQGLLQQRQGCCHSSVNSLCGEDCPRKGFWPSGFRQSPGLKLRMLLDSLSPKKWISPALSCGWQLPSCIQISASLLSSCLFCKKFNVSEAPRRCPGFQKPLNLVSHA